MATAKEINAVKPDVDLRLSHDEAVVLYRVAGEIVGPDNGPRGKMNNIYAALAWIVSDAEAAASVRVGEAHARYNLWIDTPDKP